MSDTLPLLADVPLWERLPERPVSPVEFAAALPENVPGGYMTASAHNETVLGQNEITNVVVESSGGVYYLLVLDGDEWVKRDTANLTGLAGVAEALDEWGIITWNPTVFVRAGGGHGGLHSDEITRYSPREACLSANEWHTVDHREFIYERERLAEAHVNDSRPARNEHEALEPIDGYELGDEVAVPVAVGGPNAYNEVSGTVVQKRDDGELELVVDDGETARFITEHESVGDSNGSSSNGHDLTAVDGVNANVGVRLAKAGYENTADLRAASHDELTEVSGVNSGLATRIKSDVGNERRTDLDAVTIDYTLSQNTPEPGTETRAGVRLAFDVEPDEVDYTEVGEAEVELVDESEVLHTVGEKNVAVTPETRANVEGPLGAVVSTIRQSFGDDAVPDDLRNVVETSEQAASAAADAMEQRINSASPTTATESGIGATPRDITAAAVETTEANVDLDATDEAVRSAAEQVADEAREQAHEQAAERRR